MKSKKLKSFMCFINLFLFASFCQSVVKLNGDTNSVPVPKESATGICISTNFLGHECVSATLLHPQWVVTTRIDGEEAFFVEGTLTVVVFKDDAGHMHVSKVDRWVHDVPIKLANSKLIFGHLATPVTGIAIPEIDYTNPLFLVGKTATLSGYQWGVAHPRLENLHNVGRCENFTVPEGFVEAVLNIPKCAARISLEDFTACTKREGLLHALNEGLEAYPQKEELHFPLLDSSPITKFLRKTLVLRFRKWEESLRLHGNPIRTFFAGLPSDPRWAGKEILRGYQNGVTRFPERIAGEGIPVTCDRGAGLYIWNEKKKTHLLSGVLLGTMHNNCKLLRPCGYGSLLTSMTAPASYVYQRFSELCLGVPFTPSVDAALEEEISEPSPSATSHTGPKKTKKKKKKKKISSASVAKTPESISGGTPITSSESIGVPLPVENKPLAQVLTEKVRKEEETSFVGIVSEIIFGTAKSLENTRWVSIVSKQKPCGQSYKELYTFHFKENGECTRYISILRYRSTLDDHIAHGKWEILESESRRQLVIRLAPFYGHKSSGELVYSFALNLEHGKLVWSESENSADYVDPLQRKRRTPLLLHQTTHTNADLLKGFTYEELYEGILCEFPETLTLLSQEYSKFGVRASLKELMGEWFFVPETGSASATYQDVLVLEESRAHFSGRIYEPSLKYVYVLEDDQYRRVLCLHLKPFDKDAFPITLGLYQSLTGEYLLATNQVSFKDYQTGQNYVSRKSRFYQKIR